jgi:hypothetical protein
LFFRHIICCNINFLWTIITLQLQSMEDELKNFYIIQKYEPLSLIFLSVFAIAITLQFLSMFMHRWMLFVFNDRVKIFLYHESPKVSLISWQVSHWSFTQTIKL